MSIKVDVEMSQNGYKVDLGGAMGMSSEEFIEKLKSPDGIKINVVSRQCSRYWTGEYTAVIHITEYDR